jgi:uncharacterized repeat protein (TIGR04076 family)
MSKLKITVLRTMSNADFAAEYCESADVTPCTAFKEGQEFVLDSPMDCPEGFCGWAWEDLHKGVLTLMKGGSFKGWMKDDKTLISCCTDGIRPVVFKLERIDE